MELEDRPTWEKTSNPVDITEIGRRRSRLDYYKRGWNLRCTD
jgi:hypothetical protein